MQGRRSRAGGTDARARKQNRIPRRMAPLGATPHRPAVPAEGDRHRGLLHGVADVPCALDRAALLPNGAGTRRCCRRSRGQWRQACMIVSSCWRPSRSYCRGPGGASRAFSRSLPCSASPTRRDGSHGSFSTAFYWGSWRSIRGRSAPPDHARVLDIARLIVALTYVFSGLQKINLNFMEYDFPWIVSPITGLLPSATGLLGAFGFVVPFIQVAFGIGLLTRRYRRVSLWAAVCMHLFILAMFGPAGLNWNNVIWPWTATMAVFDVLLFSREIRFSWRKAATRRDPGCLAAIVLFVLLPLLSFFNLSGFVYLSSALYSGNLAGGADLPQRHRGRLAGPRDQVAAGPHIARHQCPEHSALGDGGSQRDALLGNPCLQGGGQRRLQRNARPQPACSHRQGTAHVLQPSESGYRCAEL